jgi:hypothetical protein
MVPYELKTSPDTNGYEVRLTNDGALLGYVEPTDEEGIWLALSVFDEDFFCEADSESRAAEEVWGVYDEQL